MNPRNLAHMDACIRNIAHNAPEGEQRACVEAGIRSLEYMHDGAADVLKAVMRLKKENPGVFQAFVDLIGMGAELVDVRKTQ